MAFLLHLPLIALLCWKLYQHSYRQPLISFYWWAVSAKVLAGISIGLLYTYYYSYGGDTFAYFEEASRLADFARQSPDTYFHLLFFTDSGAEAFLSSLSSWHQPRAFFMVKLVSVLCLFTLNSYWLCSIYLSLFCFYELWRLANTLAGIFPGSAVAAGIGFLLWPSVVFWSAGLTKESIAMACIAGIVRLFLIWYHLLANQGISLPVHTGSRETTDVKPDQPDGSHLLSSFPSRLSAMGSAFLLAVYLLVLWKMKYYYLAALVPALLAFLLTSMLAKRFLPRKNTAIQLSVLVAVFVAILLAATFLHPNLRMEAFLEALVTNHDITVVASNPQNIIHFTNLQAKAGNVALHLPEAMFAGIFRPLAWEGSTVLHTLVGLENLLLLFITLYVLFIKGRSMQWLQPSYALLAAVTLLYVCLLAALLALSSPNFGALSRYKVAFMPFFVYVLMWAAGAVSIKSLGKGGNSGIIYKKEKPL
jgi:uncharacterized membrane protein